MRIGLGQFNELTDEKLAFIKQLGANDFLMNTPKLPGDKQWEYNDLAALHQRADAADLRLMALENVPVSFYDRVMLGLPGRDVQIEHMKNTIRNMGKADIPILGYHWMPNSVWRTPEMASLRGCGRTMNTISNEFYRWRNPKMFNSRFIQTIRPLNLSEV
jgi:mannonate dehydratase